MNTVTTAAIIGSLKINFQGWHDRIRTETDPVRLLGIDNERGSVCGLIRGIAFTADERAGDELRAYVKAEEEAFIEAFDKRLQAISK